MMTILGGLMKKYRTLALIAASMATLTPTLSFASAGPSSTMTINMVVARETSFDVYSAAVFTEPVGCSVNNMLRVYSDAPNYNVIVSTIITAFSTGKSVRFWVAECDGDGTPIIRAAYAFN